jgi:hypothetical protein
VASPAAGDGCFRAEAHIANWNAACVFDLGRVKNWAREERAELFSPLFFSRRWSRPVLFFKLTKSRQNF